MIYKNVQRIKIINIHLLIGIIVLLWINGGIINYFFRYTPDIIKISIFAIWFLVAICYKKYFIQCFIINSYSIFIFFAILIIVKIASFNVSVDYYIKVTIFLLMIYAIFLFYWKYEFGKIRYILWAIIIDDIYIAINTLWNLRKIPNLSRYLSMSEDNIREYLGKSGADFIAIGNYAYAYSLVFLGLYSFIRFIDRGGKKFIFIYGFCYLLLLKMEFTISIIFLFGMSILYAVFLMKRKQLRIVLFLLLVIFILIGVVIGIPEILKVVSSFFPYGIKVRILELSQMLQNSLSDKTDLGLRLSLYADSAESFTKNIAGGILLHGNGKIGGHSTILDFLGIMGLTTIPIFWFFYMHYQSVKKKLSKQSINGLKCGYLYFGLLGIVNTTYIPSILLYLIIVFPFLLYEEKIHENTLHHSCNR